MVQKTLDAVLYIMGKVAHLLAERPRRGSGTPGAAPPTAAELVVHGAGQHEELLLQELALILLALPQLVIILELRYQQAGDAAEEGIRRRLLRRNDHGGGPAAASEDWGRLKGGEGINATAFPFAFFFCLLVYMGRDGPCMVKKISLFPPLNHHGDTNFPVTIHEVHFLHLLCFNS
jgi:hypothetical protein